MMISRPASDRLSRSIVSAWREYAERVASCHSTLLLLIVYFVVLGPSAMIGRVFGIRLLDLDPAATPSWHEREPVDPSLDALSRQF